MSAVEPLQTVKKSLKVFYREVGKEREKNNYKFVTT